MIFGVHHQAYQAYFAGNDEEEAEGCPALAWISFSTAGATTIRS